MEFLQPDVFYKVPEQSNKNTKRVEKKYEFSITRTTGPYDGDLRTEVGNKYVFPTQLPNYNASSLNLFWRMSGY